MKVKLENLVKRFGKILAVNNFNLTIRKNELLAVVGPSGCGKTTLLRLIAGLEIPDRGTIYLESKILFSRERGIFVPPYKRKIGMVFQNYTLWPHMDIFHNIAYPLKIKHAKRDIVKREVERALSLVRLNHITKRYPHEISGGEQQRAALARALVMNPEILLLDEPLSNLDAKLREEMRFEIKRIQKETQLTVIYVTHDQSEAMAIADRIAVMKDGFLIQVDTPRKIYNYPKTEFVARFIGRANLISCQVKEISGKKVIELNGAVIKIDGIEDIPAGKRVFSVRPEDIKLTRKGEDGVGEIKSIVYLGNIINYKLSIGNIDLEVQTTPAEVFEVGEKVYLNICHATPVE